MTSEMKKQTAVILQTLAHTLFIVVPLIFVFEISTSSFTGDFAKWIAACSFTADLSWVGFLYSVGVVNLVVLLELFFSSPVPVFVRRIEVVAILSLFFLSALILAAIGLRKLFISTCN